MMLRWWQKTGHKPVVLMGGGTTKIGDPSGRDETRQLLTDEAIAANMAGIRRVFDKYITFGDGPRDALMVNNAEWLDKLLYIPLLRDVGRHFSVNRMLTMDSVRLRLERDQPLSFLEFNYMILQSYDFVELFKRHNRIVRKDGQDRGRRSLAQSAATEPVRLLAILAQYRGCRRRPLSQAVHRHAA